MSALKTGIDSAYAFRFVRLMQKSFSEWKAFEYGIIDDRGNVLKRPKTDEEKSAYTPFHASIRSFKRTLNTVPGLTGLTSAMAGWSAISSRFSLTENDVQFIVKELNNPIFEDLVAGDSGGNPTNIAAGVTTGSVVSAGPSPMGKPKKRKIVNLKK